MWRYKLFLKRPQPVLNVSQIHTWWVWVWVFVWVSQNKHEQLNETSRIMLGVVATCRGDESDGTRCNSEIWRHLPGLFLAAVPAVVMALFYAQPPTAHVTDLPISSPPPDPVACSQEPPLVPDLTDSVQTPISSFCTIHLNIILLPRNRTHLSSLHSPCVPHARPILDLIIIVCWWPAHSEAPCSAIFFQPHKPSHLGPNISLVPNSQMS